MIKKIGITILLIYGCTICFGQSSNVDSLRAKLASTTNLLERFDLLNNIVLDITSFRGNNIDSTATLQMLEIAQELKNDSLKAISYNWLGTYFYQQKGDNTSALEYYFKALPLAEKLKEKRRISSIYFDMALVYFDMLEYEKALEVTRKGGENLPEKSNPMYDFMLLQFEANMTQYFLITKHADSAFYYAQRCHETTGRFNNAVAYVFLDHMNLAAASALSGDVQKADKYFITSLSLQDSIQNITSQLLFYNNYIPFLLTNGKTNEGIIQSRKLFELGLESDNNNLKLAGAGYLRQLYDTLNQIDSAYYYSQMVAAINSQIFSQENKNKVQALVFSDQLRSIEEKNKAEAYQNQLKLYGLLTGLGVFFIIAFLLYRNNRQQQKTNQALETTLNNLKSTQAQLIQSEKMASLGELTAGIAHEIQNPLNFVNNFSEVNQELISEIRDEISKMNYEEVDQLAIDLQANEEKINHHGKRADAIVKGMLQHSRSSSGEKEPTDINALADEYLRLAYHGLRAKDKSFNATMNTDFDGLIGKVPVVPQDIGRVLLNLINNAFFAVRDVKNPLVTVTTKAFPLGEGEYKGVKICVSDNGPGIPEQVRDKIFQPFFTTKPTGQGTGLGLSMSYDIVKAHGGELKVDTNEGAGTSFTIELPTS